MRSTGGRGPHARRVEEVAGYRVLRAAGTGSRSRVLVGHAADGPVALKVVATEDARVAAEIEALERGRGEHVVTLQDVGADARTTVLVLERLRPVALADLLQRRGALDAGEAVTILAPLAATVERLHAAGVAHGALSVGAVGFRGDGAPTLFGFGAAELFAPGAPEVVRETVPGVRHDRAALRDLAALVLGRVGGPQAAAARRLASELPHGAAGMLAPALFGLATPTAVSFDADEEHGTAMRAGETAEVATVDDVGTSASPPLVVPPWLRALIPDGWRERVDGVLGRVAAVWSGWSASRRRLVLAGAAGMLTVVLAVSVVPTAPDDPASGAIPAPEVTSASPVVDDLPGDPIAAADVLLERRERCLRELSALCLDGVTQPGSAAQADDIALVRLLQAGGEYPHDGVAPGEAVLVERLGDSALLDLPEGSSPRSLLLLRTAEGWRIRDYLDAPAESGPG